MSPIPNPRLLFIRRPVGYPDPEKDFKYDSSESIDLETVPLDGGFLTKTLYLSLDPYLRNRMRNGWELGSLVKNFGVGEVLRSETDAYKKGDIVYGSQAFKTYIVYPASVATSGALRVIRNEARLPLSLYIGIAGMPGKTAYYGLKEIAEYKAGENIFVSTAAGPVGQMVCQIAKAAGLRVLGSTGSDEKVQFLEEKLGIDQAFNYKTASTVEELQKFGGIDIYWDNVGGETLDAALDAMNRFGRIIVCGHITGYNTESAEERTGVKNTGNMIYRELKMQGLNVSTYEHKYGDEFYATIPKMIAEGKIKYLEDVTEGLDKAPEVLVKVLKGDNLGKAVIKL